MGRSLTPAAVDALRLTEAARKGTPEASVGYRIAHNTLGRIEETVIGDIRLRRRKSSFRQRNRPRSKPWEWGHWERLPGDYIVIRLLRKRSRCSGRGLQEEEPPASHSRRARPPDKTNLMCRESGPACGQIDPAASPWYRLSREQLVLRLTDRSFFNATRVGGEGSQHDALGRLVSTWLIASDTRWRRDRRCNLGAALLVCYPPVARWWRMWGHLNLVPRCVPVLLALGVSLYAVHEQLLGGISNEMESDGVAPGLSSVRPCRPPLLR
jgi:hypothetical protein